MASADTMAEAASAPGAVGGPPAPTAVDASMILMHRWQTWPRVRWRGRSLWNLDVPSMDMEAASDSGLGFVPPPQVGYGTDNPAAMAADAPWQQPEPPRPKGRWQHN